jgi:hypothetical protein
MYHFFCTLVVFVQIFFKKISVKDTSKNQNCIDKKVFSETINDNANLFKIP